MDLFDPDNVLLAVASNIPVLPMTGFVIQGHIWVLHGRPWSEKLGGTLQTIIQYFCWKATSST